MSLDNIRIILVEPAGPLNVGAIARVMKNMGCKHLVLVQPHCDPLGAEARQMAVHAVDILEQAHQVSTLPQALQGCHRAIATTARKRDFPILLEPPHSALPWLLEPLGASYPSSALIFGPEDRGLSNAELHYAQRFISIPANPIYPSLNLAQAVAICCYELYNQIQLHQLAEEQPSSFPAIVTGVESRTDLGADSKTDSIANDSRAPLDLLEAYYQHLETLLLQIGYLYPHTATKRMEKLRRLFSRADLSITEVNMLRGIVRQMTWALEQSATTLNDGKLDKP